MEFKGTIDGYDVGVVTVEIETEWNLKDNQEGAAGRTLYVEIETEWNLKRKGKYYATIPQTRRDRNRVEFKASSSLNLFLNSL